MAAKGMTDAEIVAGLRSGNQEQESAALDALFPDADAVLVIVGKVVGRTAAKSTIDVARVWPSLLAVTQQFGGYIGLQLGWVPTQPEPGKVLTPDDFMR